MKLKGHMRHNVDASDPLEGFRQREYAHAVDGAIWSTWRLAWGKKRVNRWVQEVFLPRNA